MENYNRRNTTAKECLYAWYPSAPNESRQEDPKEIYANLHHSRTPKATVYSAEYDTLQQYQQSVKKSEPAYRLLQTVDQALHTPWSPHISVKDLKEDADKTMPESFERRVHSAPVFRNAPTTRVVLKIPSPTFQRGNDGDDDEGIPIPAVMERDDSDYKYNSNTTSQINHMANSYAQSNATNETRKKSILKQRPKTAQGIMQTVYNTDQSINVRGSMKQRPSSSMSRGQKQTNEQKLQELQQQQKHLAMSKSVQELANKKVTFSENAFKVVQENGNKPNSNYVIMTAEQFEKMNPQGNIKNQTIVVTNEPTWAGKHTSVPVPQQSRDPKMRTDIKVVDGHWKDQLLNRSKFLHKRPCYYVKANIENLKPDPVAPEVHYNESETYFYNTLPKKRMTFVIHPTFISEHLNVKKLELQNKPFNTGPVKYNRNYAFVY